MFYNLKRLKLSRSCCKPWCNQQGYTLLELLISLAILSILVGSFIQIVMSSVSLRSKSDLEKRASAIANYQIEQIKVDDKVPTALSEVLTLDGFTVTKSYVEKTSSLNLSEEETEQTSSAKYDEPEVTLNFSDNFSILVNQSSIANVPMSHMKENMTLSIEPISGSSTQVDYTLSYEDEIGTHKANLGRYIKHEAEAAFIKIAMVKEPANPYILSVSDVTGERVNIGIFDDFENRFLVNLSNATNSIIVEKGLISNQASAKLTTRYYEVTVVVSRGNQEYARILTTVSVNGE